jgi:hypothetical protein
VSIVMKDQAMTKNMALRYNSAIGPQAGKFSAINRASAGAVKGGAEM